MNYFDNVIIGSGISSLVFYSISYKKNKIITNASNEILNSNNFYEYDIFGGNSNIWGGYINYTRHKNFLNNKNYRKLFKKEIFKVKKIFNSKNKFSNTHCLMNNKNEIFRVKKKHFQNKILFDKIENFTIKKRFIQLTSNKRTIITKNLTLCVGNLNLIRLLYNSGLLKKKDIISFDDGKCTYVLNILPDLKKNYYIPMPINGIIEKIIFKKSKRYNTISSSLILQKFSNQSKNHKISCEEILKMNKSRLRFFLSNHITNLKINNLSIRKFILKKSKKINVFCSGTVKKYLPGPIVQDLIFDIVKN